ncbi:MAG: T9SS type A sorting domain-containing protein [Cryomorphaceae bacterium]|nr:T9SS type A sorting domain-containing protein [Cryomorphaceae bacterium]
MKKSLSLSFLLSFLFMSMAFGQTTTRPSGVQPSGNGSSATPYQIATIENLVWLADNSSTWSVNTYFIQTSDINLDGCEQWDNGKGWKPIGNYTDAFRGRYDGGGHTISNLNIERQTTSDGGHGVGLFGVVGATQQSPRAVGQLTTLDQTIYVKNLIMENCTVKGLHASGVVVGRVFGLLGTSVENCKVLQSYVEGTRTVGAVVGASNSEYIGRANVADRPMMRQCVAKNCTIQGVRGTVQSAAQNETNPNQKFGAVVGCTQRGRVENSYALDCQVIINDSINLNNETYATGIERIGGISGCLSEGAAVVNSYNTTTFDFSNCSSCSSFIGPLVGFDDPEFGNYDGADILSNSYYNVDYYNANTGLFTNNNGGARTEAQLKNRDFYAQAWLFVEPNDEGIWAINSAANDGFPYLFWEDLDATQTLDLIWIGTANNDINNSSNWKNGSPPNLNNGQARFTIAPGAKMGLNISDGNVKRVFVEKNAELIIRPGAVLEVEEQIDVLGKIVIESDALNNYGQLKFNIYESSDSDSLNGMVDFEMKLSGNGWHNISSPFTETVADSFGPGRISTDFHPNARNFFGWNASATGSNAYNYTEVLKGEDTLLGGHGYIAYFGTNGIMDSLDEEYTIRFSGYPISEVNPSLFFSTKSATSSPIEFVGDGAGADDGWNLIANPFTCVLDFYALGLGSNGTNNSFYIWDPTANKYKFWSGASGDESSEPNVAPFQSFWMQTNNNLPSNATLPLLMNAHGILVAPDAPPFLRPKKAYDRVVLHIEETQNPANNDYAVVAFIPETNDGFDGQWDAHKMRNGAEHPNIFTRDSTGYVLAVNAIDFDADYTGIKTLPLSVDGYQDGRSYTISLDKWHLLNPYHVYLEDLKTETLHDLVNDNFSFVYDENLDDRFVIHFQSITVSNQTFEDALNSKNNAFKMWIYEGVGYFEPTFDGPANIEVMDLNGKVLQAEKAQFRNGTQHTFQMPNAAAGVYTLRVQGGGLNKTIKFFYTQ